MNWLDPHESIVCILWKLARMNALSGHVIVTQLAKTIIDPYEGVSARRAEVNIQRLRAALGLKLKQVRHALIPDSMSNISSPYFRYCRPCLRRGYHSVVHQLETIQHCPIHGTWLEVQCPSCFEPVPYRLDARLLDAPFRCVHCRAFYTTWAPSFLKRKALTGEQRAAMNRLRLHHHWY